MQFLRGRTDQFRPPWAIDESRFVELCSRCDDCQSACDENIIEKGHGSFPVVNFKKGECSFCGDCVKHCSTGALHKLPFQANEKPWILKAFISEKCLNKKGVVCRSCGDSCMENALKFRPQPGGKLTLELDSENCTGCGACVAPCPEEAIEIKEAS
jgi:ferredoxin-type protein NapF